VLILAALVAIALAAFIGYVVGTRQRRDAPAEPPAATHQAPPLPLPPASAASPASLEFAAELAAARAEAARYRQLVVDIENNAPPPILQGEAEPDDLKLIVGVGPVLERMLHSQGISSFRQIARWTDRDVADFDARFPEFPGRIVRDQWVTQARALHLSKYGDSAENRGS
jgi:predicted flap endonuclease-1-like 5' DNA nuclease